MGYNCLYYASDALNWLRFFLNQHKLYKVRVLNQVTSICTRQLMLFSINTIQTNQELFREVKFSVSLVMLSKVWAAIDRSKEEEVTQFIKAIDINGDSKISKVELF